MRNLTQYEDGQAMGERWAEEDRANHVPYSAGAALLIEESKSEDRWTRAFYLGALRGYRAVCRTELAGRWGT